MQSAVTYKKTFIGILLAGCAVASGEPASEGPRTLDGYQSSVKKWSRRLSLRDDSDDWIEGSVPHNKVAYENLVSLGLFAVPSLVGNCESISLIHCTILQEITGVRIEKGLKSEKGADEYLREIKVWMRENHALQESSKIHGVVHALSQAIFRNDWNAASRCFSAGVRKQQKEAMISGAYFWAQEKCKKMDFNIRHALRSDHAVFIEEIVKDDARIFIGWPAEPTEGSQECRMRIRLVREDDAWRISDDWGLQEGQRLVIIGPVHFSKGLRIDTGEHANAVSLLLQEADEKKVIEVLKEQEKAGRWCEIQGIWHLPTKNRRVMPRGSQGAETEFGCSFEGKTVRILENTPKKERQTLPWNE